MDYEFEYLEKNPTLHVEDTPRKVNEIAKVLKNFSQFKVIVDFGCGSGFLMNELINRGIVLTLAIGIDISNQIINFAKEKNKNGKIKLFTVQEFAYLNLTFDCLFLIDIIEHIDYESFIFNERNLSCEQLVLRVPLEKTLYNNLLAICGNDPLPSLEKKYGHIHHFSLPDVNKILVNHGYIVISDMVFPLPHLGSDLLHWVQMVIWFIVPKKIYARLFGGFYLCYAKKNEYSAGS